MIDRRELDNIIFYALGLTTGERDAVYEALSSSSQNASNAPRR